MGGVMRLVVGLGNPGQQYRGTRHNIGFDVLTRLRELLGGERPKSKFDAELLEVRLGSEKIALLWPLTYMNLSGRSVRAAVDFFGLPLPNLLVVCDDFSLPWGRLRVRESGSSGGQKGLQNICQVLGSESVPRLRVGIGSPPEGWDPADYVLGKFAAAEQAEMGQVMDQAAKTVLCWAESGIREAMNRFNSPGGERTKNSGPGKQGSGEKGIGRRGDIRGAGPKSSDSGEPGSRRKNGRGLDGGSGELAD
jgi:PTH1 family peptidyl-tRNA hydrolase